MLEILIHQLMSKKVVSVTPETSVKELIRMMHKHSYKCLVVTKGKKPTGIITERDVLRILAESIDRPELMDGDASEIMSSHPVVIKQSASFFDATIISKRWKVRQLPVVDGKGNLVGLLTQSEISKAKLMVVEQQQEILKSYLNTRRQELKRACKDLKILALKDELLGIGNRYAMERDLLYTHESAKRYMRPYSLALFDIDNFKKYNKCYGQVAGEKALKRVTLHIKKSIRESDRIYRYSGETFLLLLPETTSEQANTVADRLLQSLANLAIPHNENPFKVLTMSGGIGSREADNEGSPRWNEVIEKAERRLFRAKRKGRNQVVSDHPRPTVNNPTQDGIYSKACRLYEVNWES